jgi:hypothetical protein
MQRGTIRSFPGEYKGEYIPWLHAALRTKGVSANLVERKEAGGQCGHEVRQGRMVDPNESQLYIGGWQRMARRSL